MIEGRIGSSPRAQATIGSIGPDTLHTDSSSSSSSASSSSTSFGAGLETLDEPVSTTILRDLHRVAIKLRHVLMLRDTARELRDWDLWGPLLLCLLLAATLSISAETSQAAVIFAAVFVIVWVGAGVVTFNAKLLGGNISFLQSVCVLGYSIAPLNLASILCHAWLNKYFHFAIVGVAFLWATSASVGFMAQLVPDPKRTLGVYPVLLFYLSISWMVLVQ